MKVILVRHGEAEDPASVKSDQARTLTDKGVEDVHKIGRFIRNTPLKVSKLFYSPYLRTRLTAEIISEEISFEGEPVAYDPIASGAKCSDFLSCLSSLSNSDTVLLVGHNPDITFFAAELLGNSRTAENLVFFPGSTIAINVAREKFAHGQIIWALSPDMLS
ncbi:phosphohistidine phosphatase [Leptospira ryugenii]|uniref:Phosphohistidine phosphatase n=1 Tax=Leptospira ryugenii TaxID=1917863 RepID=A0A2P2E3H8_9LEPT|nr:phosphohistidine phosphatase SixA [Leptospira ryugenii]GBF51453.1 phosphohistidine phosphatase [Leptospira ryugenii]